MTETDEVLRRSLVRPERSQHDTVVIEASSDGFAHVARCQPALERMLRRGHITRRQAIAGARIYSAWALGVCLARNAEASGNGSDPAGLTDRQMDALREYRMLREAVGGRLWSLTFHCCCLDWTPQRYANDAGHGMHKLGAMELLRHALSVAADVLRIE